MNNGNGHANGKKPFKKKMTFKQKKFVKAYIENGGNASKAGAMAGYKHPMQVGHETLRKLEHSEEFKILLSKAGLDEEFLLKRLKEGCSAKKTEFFANKGRIIDERKTVDYPTRHKYVETGLKLQGKLSNKDDAEELAKRTPLVIIIGESGLAGII